MDKNMFVERGGGGVGGEQTVFSQRFAKKALGTISNY